MMKMVMSPNPTVDVPPWSSYDDEAAALAAALQRFMPSNDEEDEYFDDHAEITVDAYSGDEFRMYEFKIRRCTRARSHDWTECPFAHPGEKARRRDPRKYHYSGVACPDFRKGSCKRGDACEYAHGVFECWLHPSRYRTQPCKDGTACRRRVCFFAHTPEQLRLVTHAGAKAPAVESYDGSPMRQHGIEGLLMKAILSSSPTSTLISPPVSPPSESPPVSPSRAMLRRASWPARSSANEVVESLYQLQLCKAKNSSPTAASSWLGNGVFGSPTGFKGGFYSLPATPTGAGGAAAWFEGEEVAERVESGRALRAKMFEKLSKDGVTSRPSGEAAAAPDVGWISELVM